MARLARIVVPGLAHHVTQRGNRRQQVFFCSDDAAVYVQLLADAFARTETRCLAWCLMPNHVHLLLTPAREDGLRAALGEAHRRYSRRVNVREGWTGYLWQGRFASFPMDEAHVRNAVMYVERNPVAAGLAERAEDWRWSSARARVAGRDDPLADLEAIDTRGLDWSRELAGGDADEAARGFEAHASTGRPFGDAGFVEKLETLTSRVLGPQKRGRKVTASK